MKKIIFILLPILIASCKKENLEPVLTKEFSIQSTRANAKYNIKVALPDNYDSNNKYSTIYVLDGDDNFNFVAEHTKRISSECLSANVLVVGIGYGNDRAVDYTPSIATEGGGGAENFMHFIKEELIPRMENEFGSDSSRENRIILGHSFGGLLAAYAFTNFNDVFGNYLMLSPSIWYDNEILLRFEQEHRGLNKENHHLVFMGIGESERSGRMQAPYLAFYNRLLNNYPQMLIKNNIEPGLNHVGSRNPNIEKALCFYFHNR